MGSLDPGQEQASDTRGDRRPLAAWRDVLGILTPLLAVGAILLYGYLSVAYDRFYRGFGIDPSDVGLSYTGILARSSGFVVVCLAIASLAAIPILTLGRLQAWRENPARLNSLRGWAGFVLILVVVALWFPMDRAGRAARDVRAGTPVGPIHPPVMPRISFLPTFAVLAVHADPAAVEPAGKPGEAPAADRLQNRKLLYLGQAAGTIVLYDPDVQQTIYLQASSIVLRVSNCNAARSRNPTCNQFQW